jgi:riboflavin kinase/FMN adenylyltransferase
LKIHHELLREMDRPLVLAIGFLDGVHRGHRALIDRARSLRKPGWRTGLLTFENHPAAYLRPGSEPPLICTPDERLRLLAEAGVEECFFVPFDGRIANLTPEQFVSDVLIARLGVRAVVTGATFRFGQKRSGDAETMRRFLTQHEVAYAPVPNLADESRRISSTRIREAIAAGETAEADRLLGHSYELRGVVEQGAGRGHELGFPTANLRVPKKLLPKDGVYAATARLDGRDFAALVSIGTNPTFGKNSRTVEAWLRDFNGIIYGCELVLRDLRFVRDQRAFAAVEELIAQMRTDAQAVAYPTYG